MSASAKTRPALVAIDDDPHVSAAVARDLRRRYGDRFVLVRADSGAQGLEATRRLKERGQPVALFLVDQRMPEMDGVTFLERAKPIFPEARRVLLTAYADTEAAIRSINDVHLDHYLLKPWEPPEQNLYPVLDDLLDDWLASVHPPFAGVRVIDHRYSPAGHELRDFLARNHVPYRFLDVERHPEIAALFPDETPGPDKLPLVLLEDGERLHRPSPGDLGNRVGLATRPEAPFYDLVVVGAGPAGLAAAVYGASEGLRTALVEKDAPGGQAGTSSRIENYLGFPSGLSGSDLSRRAVAQARRLGAELILTREVSGLRVEDPYRIAQFSDGSEIYCHALIVATGVAYRRHPAQEMDRFSSSGVYYGAATTEAVACEGEDVLVVGAGNSAGQAALFLARYARSVTIVCRGEGLPASMSHYLIQQIDAVPHIHVRPRTVIERAHGDSCLEAVTLRDVDSGEERDQKVGAVFVYIGAAPRTEWLGEQVLRDDRGFVLAGSDLITDGKPPRGWNVPRSPFLTETSVPGVFAAGDVRHASVKRVASAVGEGSITVQFVHQHLSEL